MYRITTVGSLTLGLSRSLRHASRSALAACLIAFTALALLGGTALVAQSSEGTIQGTVTDKTGAVVKGAKVTATNTATGVQVTRTTNGTGQYTLNPLQAGHYNVEVVATGFQRLLQEDVEIDSLQVLGLNLKVSAGGGDTTITITDAPPMLDTQDAAIGGTIENELYTELPLSMGGAPRDPTAFSFLMPGVQESPSAATGGGATAGTGVYGGSSQENLNETYLDGVPMSNISAQGDPTPVRNGLSVDAVDQFQVQTNGSSTGFGGIGVTNYTIKAGGNTLHGTIFDYIRNTAFDTWGYFAKVPAANGFATKPGEHQNSFGGSLGGPIFRDKLFYFVTYEGFHYTKVSNTPQYLTIPTVRERTGDFTDAFGTGDATVSGTYGIFDSTVPQRPNQFNGFLNGIPTLNVIPTSELSSISLAMQAALPLPTNLSTANNYLAGLPLENSDYTIDTRLDYTINARNKLSIVGIGGTHGFNGQPDYTTQIQLPDPYASAYFTSQKTASGVITYTYVASQTLINSLKYGYSRTWGEHFATTQNGPYSSGALGIGNTPPGNATSILPNVTFGQGGSTSQIAPFGWTSRANSGPVGTNTYSLIDTLTWVKGRHNITFGAQVQWLGSNAANYGGYSSALNLQYNGYDTENLTTLQGGSAYASFLIGAVYSGSVATQDVTTYGGRFRPLAPYIQDNWRATPKLTMNLGFRYDYLPPYHEAQNRISFINPNIVNGITGNLGVVEYAGYGAGPNPAFAPYICQCRTPVHYHNTNYEPRLGFAYSVNQSTVIRGAWGISNTHAGGTGGNVNATTGTGNNSEFAASTGWTQNGSNGTVPFFLNPSIQGVPAISVYGPGSGVGQQPNFSSIPVWTPAGNYINPLGTTGNYGFNSTLVAANCNQPNGQYCTSGTQTYADPYYGGRGPQFVNYNLGFERQINRKAVLSMNYAGSQTHFLPGGSGRGYAQNVISPDYGILFGTGLSAQITPASVPGLQATLPNFKFPYPTFSGPNATLARALSAFPQYNGFSDIWGETGNAAYHSLQVSVIQRPWHNLQGFANYTRSKTINDTGNHRTQYPVTPFDGNFTRNYTASQIDRGLASSNQTNAFNLTFTYIFPIGRGQKFFATNRIAALIGGGWQASGIYKYRDGNPIQVTRNGGCNSATYGLQGTCMVDYVPGFNAKQARINGRYGRAPGSTATNIQTIPYFNNNAFSCPDSPANNLGYACTPTFDTTAPFKLGNQARSAPDGLTGPGWWDVDLSIRRTFTVRETATLHLTFQVEGDVINATNSTFFNLSGGAATWNSTTYGTIGGQNQNIPPRDWQFAGRFRF